MGEPKTTQFKANLLSELPRVSWRNDVKLYQWEGHWYPSHILEAAIALRSHFEAHEDDVIVTSSLKTGTTWLKALVSCIIDNSPERNDCDDPLLTNFPHLLIPSLESHIYRQNQTPDLSTMVSPRLFGSHLPYKALPESIKGSNCKMVYIARNPKDTLVSQWHFLNTCMPHESIEETFESFCNGVHPFGPFFDHVLGYWKESLRQPDKILFLRYEDLKRNPMEEAKRLASFLGRPLGNDGEVDKVLRRCSIERLKGLEVNKSDVGHLAKAGPSAFFRRGIVGDWKNHFTPEMSERLDQIKHSKLQESGLELDD